MSTVVTLPERPKCDLCAEPALYDARTEMGPWAYLCPEHFAEHGIALGTGYGQQIEVEEPQHRGEPATTGHVNFVGGAVTA